MGGGGGGEDGLFFGQESFSRQGEEGNFTYQFWLDLKMKEPLSLAFGGSYTWG